MIYPWWLELPMSRIKVHGPKDVRAIEVLLHNPYWDGHFNPIITKTRLFKYFQNFTIK